jgi:4-amino-4-deoxy-L-arabinose transferase-like glycosyltransferase
VDSLNAPSDEPSERRVLFSLFLLALAFRLPHLTRYSLWLDETWRVAAAEAPFKALTKEPIALFNQLVSYDGLQRLLLTLFGHSEWSIRIPAALAGALAVPVTYRLGRIAFSRAPAIMAALLLCLSPLHITFPRKGRAMLSQV